MLPQRQKGADPDPSPLWHPPYLADDMGVSRLLRFLVPALVAFAVMPAAAPAVEPGVVIGPNTTISESALTRQSGAQWVRLFIDWSLMEPAPGSLATHQVDDLRRRATAFGPNVKVLIALVNTPGWANGGAPVTTPPSDPATFGSFAGRLASEVADDVEAYEIWNEPDGGYFWTGDASHAKYAATLKAAYGPIKQGDPTATVVTGGSVGNNFDFLEALYGFGAKGHFDAFGVHTDTACISKPPEFQYRDENGRIGRWVFTGYREVRQTMLDHGDPKPIWMTEMGWATPNATCRQGGVALAGKENDPGGVSYADQADFLKRGMACLQADSYVEKTFWFALQDSSNSTNHEERFGLLEADGDAKPAFDAFNSWARSPFAASACGEPVDRTAPQVTVAAPTAGLRFAGPLHLTASATDNLTVSKIELYVDGKKIGGAQSGSTFKLTPWDGAKNLSNGTHKLVFKAFDSALNVGTKEITVEKVDARRLTVPKALFPVTIKKRGGRKVFVSIKVKQPRGTTEKPRGKIRVFVQRKKGSRWIDVSRYTKGVSRGFRQTITLKGRGRFRIFARYAALKPYKPLRTKYYTFKV